MAYNQYDLQTTSLVKTGNLTEVYLPLWYYSSGSVSTAGTGQVNNHLQKGNSSVSSTLATLHALSANWNTSQKFCFEASINTATSGVAVYASLWDNTSNTQVTSSQISSTSYGYTVVRSGSFTLTPGHSYGVILWSGGTGSTTCYLSKASLVAFLS